MIFTCKITLSFLQVKITTYLMLDFCKITTLFSYYYNFFILYLIILLFPQKITLSWNCDFVSLKITYLKYVFFSSKIMTLWFF